MAGPAEIQAELARDATDAGQRYAQMCQASIPAPEAKAASWAAVTGGELPNATFRAVLRGFADPDQADLLAPYLDRYFAALPDLWRDGASDMAQFFAQVAYPYTAAGQRAIEATTAYLDQARPIPALARLLSEGSDDVARALRCQQLSAEAGPASR
jgi:aminopeptidase N